MKNTFKTLLMAFLFLGVNAYAQESESVEEKPQGHINENKFRQMKDLLATPNDQRTASGAPGYNYTQQQVDYVMDIKLDEDNNRIYGEEDITYHNNSKDYLPYLWIQLDQNTRAKDAKTPLANGSGPAPLYTPSGFVEEFMSEEFDGGFKIESVKMADGSAAKYKVNWTMMRIDLDKPLAPGAKVSFSIKWWYNINNYVEQGGRSGYEAFEDGNNNYIIAQFFPRLCVYDNVEGWQNMQFWGRSEFALEFGNYTVNLTVPADHVVDATGKLQNAKKVLSKEQQNRYKKAMNSFDNPVMIVNQAEAEIAEKGRSTKMKTWSFYGENVRDFAFASSRKYIWDAMAVNINGKTVMAQSLYPKEGNPLWEEHSTRVVANTLKVYSKYTFDYPYHKAVSVHAKQQGMEYPMICFNYGRPNPDGTYSDRVKNGMIGVITHEVGHNFFPMIVNSDERQWTWMDEGINSFVEILAELEYDPNFDTGNLPKDIVRYMGGDQSFLSPIMSNGNNVYQFGPNAYTKPAAGLYLLRQTIMGPELFDDAFRTYSQRWMFKHPTPADFFRSMEDASAVDLDWFFRGWFYTTDYTDIAIKGVDKYLVTDQATEEVKELAAQYNVSIADLGPRLYLTKDGGEANAMDVPVLSTYMEENPSAEASVPNYFYEITFEKPGGLVMPIIVEYTYADGSTKREMYPAEIWRMNDKEVSKLISSDKEIVGILLDPDLETADVDTSNNAWPKPVETKFDEVKEQVKG
jgi:hypothetical protein